MIAYAKTDEADRKWDGTRPPGIGGGPAFWEPPPGAASPPTEPEAAHWKPWVLSRNDQFRLPPPAYGSPEFRAAAQDVVDVGRNLTPEQQRIAKSGRARREPKLPAGIALPGRTAPTAHLERAYAAAMPCRLAR